MEDNQVEMIPYAVETRELPWTGWKWEAKIEEIGLLAYGETKEAAFAAIMARYASWLEKK